MRLFRLFSLLIFVVSCDNSQIPSTSPEKKEEVVYSKNTDELKKHINLSDIHILESTWSIINNNRDSTNNSFFDVEPDANQWRLYAAVTTDSDLSFIKNKCSLERIDNFKKLDKKINIRKLTNSHKFNSLSDYEIFSACTLSGSQFIMGIVAIDEENGVLLVLMETFS